MLQLIAAIPTIMSAVGKVSQLFRKGQDTVAEISGAPSQASNPEELQTEIQQLLPEQQNRWAEIMSKEVDKYAAQNKRLSVEIGLVDRNITSKLNRDAAGEIAIMRMTTRPWTVRWMVYYIIFPFFLVVVDLIQHLIITWLPFLQKWINPFNTFEYVFGVMKYPENLDANMLEKLAALFSKNGGPTTFAGELYSESIPWVVSIILGYMGLREVGKRRGYADKTPEISSNSMVPSPFTVATQALSQGTNLVANVKKFFKKWDCKVW